MTRRKRGRDKPRGRRRNRKKILPVLNIRAARKIGRHSAEVGLEPRHEPPRWDQRHEPFPEERALEDVLGLYIVEGKHYLRGKRKHEGTKEKEVAT